jgi:predicted nucleotidyltransferase
MGRLILEGIVGSQAHGLATPESDIDTAGVFVLPTETILGIHPYRETVARHDGVDKKVDPDKARHEVGKFIRLCMTANPSVLEMLFLPEHITMEPEGELILDARTAFLSTKIRDTHIGYAQQQIKRIKNRGDGSFAADTRKRTEKHARHVYRLIIQGTKALTEGRFTVRLSPEEAAMARAFGALAVTDLEVFLDNAESLLYGLDQIESTLPDKPDYDVINDLLVTIRKMNLC